MSVRIGSNISSLKAQRSLSQAVSEAENVTARLSTGQRINKASDDAAGLAVSAGLNFNSRVFSQAIRNINDGVSALTIAEQSLARLSDITTRQKELAEQSANGTFSLTQRQALNKEATELNNEYNRILATSKFNNRQLYQDTPVTFTLQAGVGTGATLDLSIGGALAITTTSDGSTASSLNVDAGVAGAMRFDFDAASLQPGYVERFQFTEHTSGIVETGEFQLSANASSNLTGAGDGLQLGDNYYIWLNDGSLFDPGGNGTGVEVNISGMNDDDAANAIVSTINGLTGSTYISAYYSGGGVFGFNYTIVGDQTDVTAFGPTALSEFSYSAGYPGGTMYTTSDYIQFNSGGTTYHVVFGVDGIPANDPGLGGVLLEVGVGGYTSGSDIAANVAFFLNGTGEFRAIVDGSGLLEVSRLDRSSFSPSVNVNDGGTVNQYNLAPSNIITGDKFEFQYNGADYYVYYTTMAGNGDPGGVGTGIEVLISYSDSPDQIASLTAASINPLLSGFVSANAQGNFLTITSANAGVAPIFVGASLDGSFVETQYVMPLAGNVDHTSNTFTQTAHGLTTGQRIRLSSGTLPGGLSLSTDYYAIADDANTFRLATSSVNALGGNAINITTTGQGTLGFTAYSVGGAPVVTSSLQAESIDLTTVGGACTALDTLTARQNRIALEVGQQGAFQSRMQIAANNLESAREQYNAAYGRIVDTDVASESAALVRSQIIQQTAASILAQANQQPSIALRLLT